MQEKGSSSRTLFGGLDVLSEERGNAEMDATIAEYHLLDGGLTQFNVGR